MKLLNLLTTICLLFLSACSRNRHYAEDGRVYYTSGIGLGTVIAVVISWSRNKSILWAIIHGILGWFYVIYALLVKKKD